MEGEWEGGLDRFGIGVEGGGIDWRRGRGKIAGEIGKKDEEGSKNMRR